MELIVIVSLVERWGRTSASQGLSEHWNMVGESRMAMDFIGGTWSHDYSTRPVMTLTDIWALSGRCATS